MKVTFYVATLADAINRASRIAPNKGVAFDKAHGVLLEIDPDTKHVEVRATNLELFYRERINDVVEVEGQERTKWRMPSALLNGILQGLPVEAEVTFEQKGSAIQMKCGRKRAALRVAADSDMFPAWGEFDPTEGDWIKAQGLGQRVQQVAWATDNQNVPFTGIHFDGHHVIATDRYKMAMVPLSVPLESPITVPLTTLAGVLASLPGEMMLKVEGDGKQLLLRVGDEIDILTSAYEAAYPDLSRVTDKDDYDKKVHVPRERLHDIINNMVVLVKTERYPRMKVQFADNELTVKMTVPDVGAMEDVIEVEWEYDPLEVDFTPDYVMKALTGTDASTIEWCFTEPNKISFMKDKADYRAWVMPRKETDPS